MYMKSYRLLSMSNKRPLFNLISCSYLSPVLVEWRKFRSKVCNQKMPTYAPSACPLLH